MVVPFYIPTNNAGEFLLLHILANIGDVSLPNINCCGGYVGTNLFVVHLLASK